MIGLLSEEEKVSSHSMKVQKAAVKAWSLSLSENDYNATEWVNITVRL